MTQEQKRIKLAEFEGFESCGKQFYGGAETWSRGNGPALLPYALPDYFRDLNATNNLENKLPKNQLGTYHTLLADFMEQKHEDDPNVIQGYARSMAISASAKERAETLGKFLNLW